MQGALLKASLSTIYNCSMSTDNFTYFEKFNGVEKLLALTNTPSERLNMTALFALAYLIDEKNNHLIASKDGEYLVFEAPVGWKGTSHI